MHRLLYVSFAAMFVTFGCSKRETATSSDAAEQNAGFPNPTMSQRSGGSQEYAKAPTGGSTPASPQAPPDGPTRVATSQITDSATVTIPSMVIRTGQASIEVGSIDEASVKVRQLAREAGGYVANSSVLSGKNRIRSATFELKIPSARFEQMQAGLSSIGTVESVDIKAEDVGEEFVDVGARLANSRRLEQRLLELLAQRTGKLADVLEVEQALARLREEIERYEGRMRYLRTRVAMSTLTVTVHEARPILDAVGRNPVSEAFKTAWRNFVGFMTGCIELLGVLIPLAVVVFGAWRLYLRLRKPRERPPTA